MINKIGSKIYYCTKTGNILVQIGDMQGFVEKTTFEEDYEIYANLKEREKFSIGLLEFEFGEYDKNRPAGSTGAKVNLDTGKLEFTFDPLPEIEEPKDLEKIVENMKEKIGNLEQDNADMKYVLMMGGLI